MTQAALSLFDDGRIDIPASGEVPRTLVPGVVWDAEAEARFVEEVDRMVRFGLGRKPYPLEDAVRTARWSVEADLHRQLIKRELQIANRTHDPERKRELVARWRGEYGFVRCDELVRLLKSPNAKKTVLEEW